MTILPVSQFEIVCGSIALTWLAFGAMFIVSWRQDSKMKNKLGRLLSRMFTIGTIGLLLSVFTLMFGSIEASISSEQPKPPTSLKPPDGWWKCNR